MPLIQRQFNLTVIGVKAWVSNYTPILNMDVIAYPCINFETGLANLVFGLP